MSPRAVAEATGGEREKMLWYAHSQREREGGGEEAPTLVKDACFLTRNVFRTHKARDFWANTRSYNSAMYTWHAHCGLIGGFMWRKTEAFFRERVAVFSRAILPYFRMWGLEETVVYIRLILHIHTLIQIRRNTFKGRWQKKETLNLRQNNTCKVSQTGCAALSQDRCGQVFNK